MLARRTDAVILLGQESVNSSSDEVSVQIRRSAADDHERSCQLIESLQGRFPRTSNTGSRDALTYHGQGQSSRLVVRLCFLPDMAAPLASGRVPTLAR